MIHANSLYARLLSWLLLPLLALSGFMTHQAWLDAQQTADRVYDRLLEAATLAISEQVQWQDDALWLDLPAVALEMLSTDAQERVFYSLHDSDGTFVTGNLALPAISDNQTTSRSSDDIIALGDITHQDMTLRLASRHARVDVWRTPAGFEVRVAHTREGREQLAGQLLRRNLSYILVMAALSMSILLIAIHTALAPLSRLRHALRGRDPHNLAPLTLPLPRELAELRETLNELLGRLRRLRHDQERFISDASHQLRTPLAGLSARAELALRQQDPEQWRNALHAMLAASNHASRQATQLLSLTRLENPESQPQLIPVDLTTVARGAVGQHWSSCQRAGVDLGFAMTQADPEQTDTTDCRVKGQAWQLEEALANLIDNARHYGADRITLQVLCHPPRLVIDDNGPGIPAELREQALQPFYRISHTPQGSGLGLAIVHSIARAHGAQLLLGESPEGGLRATLRFPDAPTDQPNA